MAEAEKTTTGGPAEGPSDFDKLLAKAKKLGEKTQSVQVKGFGSFHVRPITKAEQAQLASNVQDEKDEVKQEVLAQAALLSIAVSEPKLTIAEWQQLFEVTPQYAIDEVLEIALEGAGVRAEDLAAAVEAAAGRFPSTG